MADDTPKRKNKPGQGRPFKMKIWVEALKIVIENKKIAFLTDEELVFKVNKEIADKECHITVRTFKNWKAGKVPDEDPIAEEFTELYRDALIEQKLSLIESIAEGGDKNWYRLGWLLERKFGDEFNLKQISEVKHTSNQPVIQIQAADAKQAELIQNIIDVDFVEVPKNVIALKAENNEKKDDYDF